MQGGGGDEYGVVGLVLRDTSHIEKREKSTRLAFIVEIHHALFQKKRFIGNEISN